MTVGEPRVELDMEAVRTFPNRLLGSTVPGVQIRAVGRQFERKAANVQRLYRAPKVRGINQHVDVPAHLEHRRTIGERRDCESFEEQQWDFRSGKRLGQLAAFASD